LSSGTSDRRRWLKHGLAAGGAALVAPWLARAAGADDSLPDSEATERLAWAAEKDPWRQLPKILERIRPPVFPPARFDVTRFGASGTSGADSRPAFTSAILACWRAGGGTVVVPSGQYRLDGPLYLRSNVNLHLTRDAVLRFSTHPAHYLPEVLVRWEGTRCFNYSPLIYSYQERNIAITGAGVVDGQATDEQGGWMKIVRLAPERTKETLRSMGRGGVPVDKRIFGALSNLRPQMFHPYGCANILVEGVTFRHSPFWTVNPTFCTNVTVRGITVEGNRPTRLNNDDSVLPDSSQDVLIENSSFDSLCDNIAIKAGRDNDAWGGMACENIVVRNCNLRRSWGAVVVGSEVSGGVRNVFIEDNVIGEARYALYIKSNAFRGGVVENLYFRNNRIGQVEDCIRIESSFDQVAKHRHITPFRNFHFERITCASASGAGISSDGLSALPISEIYFRDVNIQKARQPVMISNTRRYSFDNVTVSARRIR
jgi:polygalacturonase